MLLSLLTPPAAKATEVRLLRLSGGYPHTCLGPIGLHAGNRFLGASFPQFLRGEKPGMGCVEGAQHTPGGF